MLELKSLHSKLNSIGETAVHTDSGARSRKIRNSFVKFAHRDERKKNKQTNKTKQKKPSLGGHGKCKLSDYWHIKVLFIDFQGSLKETYVQRSPCI